MCSVFGTVDVNAFALPFPNNSDHTVQISQTISNVLRVPDAHGGASDGRGAKKRRKLENGGSVALQSADEFDPSQSVVLAHVALDLVSCPASPIDLARILMLTYVEPPCRTAAVAEGSRRMSYICLINPRGFQAIRHTGVYHLAKAHVDLVRIYSTCHHLPRVPRPDHTAPSENNHSYKHTEHAKGASDLPPLHLVSTGPRSTVGRARVRDSVVLGRSRCGAPTPWR
jgi:hypothetical protein